MPEEVIGAGRLKGVTYESRLSKGVVLHHATLTGPMHRKERLALYRALLYRHRGDVFAYIIDNPKGHENEWTLPDMHLQDQMLWNSGIRTVIGAIVTRDAGYASLITLALTSAESLGLTARLTASSSLDEAERFVADELAMHLIEPRLP